jgi:hypothetical protein
VNFGFSVFATPVVMRYQLIAMILLFCYSMLLLEMPPRTATKIAAAR